MSFEGVNVAWVREQLLGFLEETAPVRNGFTDGVTTACSRERIIELLEIVHPILDRLYPFWRGENHAAGLDEYDEPLLEERDAVRRLLVRLRYQDD